MIAFFEILKWNGRSYLDDAASVRRKKLERVISPIPRYAILSESKRFSCRDHDALQAYYERILGRGEEGLIIKACSGRYNPYSKACWRKLKPNYIDGYCDTGEVCIVAAKSDSDTRVDKNWRTLILVLLIPQCF